MNRALAASSGVITPATRPARWSGLRPPGLTSSICSEVPCGSCCSVRRNSPPAERFSTWHANAADGPRTCATTPRGLTRVYFLFSLLVATA